jgi:putative heme-binding domain-containing protein
LLASATPDEVKRAAIEGLFSTRDKFAAEPMFASATKLSAPLKSLILNESINRPEWTDSLLDAMEKALITTEDLGPVLIDRLRNHPNKPLAKRAGIILEKLKSPAAVAREKLITDLTPLVLEGGDAAKGKLTFQSACAICHKINGEGASVAPELTGMGAHPRGELLVHIVDPNREVDPSFASWQIETKDGATLVGIVTRENAETVTLRDPAAEREIRKDNIKKRTATQRSLMPEGFEGLGADGLKNLLAYLESASPSDFKSLDLSKAATVDGRLGLFASEKALTDSLEFVKYGTLKVGKVPFYVINPASRSDGRNLIVLKGGSGQAAKQPQSVEIPVQKVAAKAVHILGGVGGWAFPWVKDREASLSLTVHYQGGDSEVIALVNGEEIADYNGRHDVKGSTHAQGLVKAHQIRTVTKPLAKIGVIERITLSSAGGSIAPLVAAITLETR